MRDNSGIPPFVLAYAVLVAFVLVTALLGSAPPEVTARMCAPSRARVRRSVPTSLRSSPRRSRAATPCTVAVP